MLYVLLYFNPKILESKRSRMREIVDKHFSDNWVIPYYLGYYVDLCQWWEPYQAANLAIKNTTELTNIR
jgi:WASH complex subunit strumpellin